jgi:hypothetical protein
MASAPCLPRSWARGKIPLKSTLLPGVDGLANNLIHRMCAELMAGAHRAMKRDIFDSTGVRNCRAGTRSQAFPGAAAFLCIALILF